MTESKELQLRKYMQGDQAIQRFTDLFGNEKVAKNYIGQVLIVVSQSKALADCEQKSILASALRAAALRLSVDPGLRQAYLVPFKGKCTLIIGWKGLKDMAIRTGRYSYIQTSPIYEGENMEQDRITGQCKITGNRTSKTIIGWYAGFKMTSQYGGFEASEYMSIEEIEEHKKQYSKGASREDSAWKTAPKVMQMKTVLRRLINRHGYIDPNDENLINEINTEEQEYPELDFEVGEDHKDTPLIEGEVVESAEEAIEDLGYDDLIKTKSAYMKAAKTAVGYNDPGLFQKVLAGQKNDYNKAIEILIEQHVPPAK